MHHSKNLPPMAEMGHFRPRRSHQQVTPCRLCLESGNKFRALAAQAAGETCPGGSAIDALFTGRLVRTAKLISLLPNVGHFILRQ